MAKKVLPEKVFKPEPVIQQPSVVLDLAKPSDFLTSKGFQQVHEGQRISATFEEIHQLLKEYREL